MAKLSQTTLTKPEGTSMPSVVVPRVGLEPTLYGF
jgi:hypothetical protein